jgi:TatA/E family protein of Tat protein translocase
MFRNPLTDAVVVLVVMLLFFGPKRLPMLSRSIGESIKEFRGIDSASAANEDASLGSGEKAGDRTAWQTADAPDRPAR